VWRSLLTDNAMSGSTRPPLSNRVRAYIYPVAIFGLAAACRSAFQVATTHPDPSWLWLAALTLLSGLLDVKLPYVTVTISISETFVFFGTVLFGASVGTVLVLMDALVLMTKVSWRRWRRREQLLFKEQLVFNIAAPPLSIWLAASIAQLGPLFRTTSALGTVFAAKLCAFTFLYFLLNSWLITVAIAIQSRARFFAGWWSIWRQSQVQPLFNYFAGASVAALLVYNSRQLDAHFLAIAPLLVVIYLTYDWSTKKVEAERERTEAEHQRAEAEHQRAETERQKSVELKLVFMRAIQTLAMMVESKDEVTGGHIQRVKRNTMALAERLGIREERELDALEAAAVLHDTGKVAVPEYILNKPGPLNASEFSKMKEHASVGAEIVKSIGFPYLVDPIVRHHHECWNGSGYPDGLKGEEIPLGARILSVVDCYDALTSDRPYRPRMTRHEATQVLRERRGSFYDPRVVDEFVAMLDRVEEQGTAGEPDADSPSAMRLGEEQLEAISATAAEAREFNELRRELPKTTSIASASEVLFRHLRRVLPAATCALYLPSLESNELRVVACAGSGSSSIEALSVPLGERISGWAFAHKQVVLNSDATLELGPVARTFAVPLRYALVVPLVERNQAMAVIAVFGERPFDGDHQRILESAATLFHATLLPVTTSDNRQGPRVRANELGHKLH
jgi:putative nucleotidyltransferase with HDIG domain